MDIKATKNTPAVSYDAATHRLWLAGISAPENAAEFYRPILDCCGMLASDILTPVLVRVELRYFNSSSMKSMFMLLDLFRQALEKGKPVQVQWVVEQEDEFMQESGETLQELLGIPMQFIESTGEAAA